jgi:hypothetical protein
VPWHHVADLESGILDRASHAVIGPGCGKRQQMTARLEHSQAFGPQLDAVRNVAPVPNLAHKSLVADPVPTVRHFRIVLAGVATARNLRQVIGWIGDDGIYAGVAYAAHDLQAVAQMGRVALTHPPFSY